MKLNDLNINQRAIIYDIKGEALMLERLMALGFIPGNEVIKIRKNRSLAVYQIVNSMFALRKKESDLIEVLVKDDDVDGTL